MDVINPATNEIVDRVDEDTPESIATKLAAARWWQPLWASRPFLDRWSAILGFRNAIIERTDDLAATLTRETGKPITQSRNELVGVVPRLDFFLAETEDALAAREVRRDEGLVERISYEPLGVIANISAWNYPWFVGSNVFVPALLAGNAVLHKPSELCPGTGRAIAELLWASGVPEDVFALVLGGGEAGAALVEQDVDGVFFTGSSATGRRIAEAVAGRMIPVQLELGGKDPVYVCDDVDVTAVAAALVDGAFYNAGQSCCAVERIYVHERVHDQFVERFLDGVADLVVGDPTDEKTYLGPLTRSQQAELLQQQVADAVARGATLRTGGRVADREGGTWFEPTVLTDVDTTMAVMRDESFGPIIGIQTVADDAQAVREMNDTAYGLTAGVFTPDEDRARAILSAVDAGSAYWNCCDRVSPRLPWSGRHGSGIGTTLSTIGIQSFARPKAWHLRPDV